MRLINADAVIEKAHHEAKAMPEPFKSEFGVLVEWIVNKTPSVESEIVRCKDCKYRGGLSGFYCDVVEKAVGVDSFCSWAERRLIDG